MKCPACAAEVFDIDVKCGACGAALASSGSHRMIGTVVLGMYELVDVLGQGGMSVVFKARHKLTEQEVALKILPPELAANSQVKGRFLEEAKALAALYYPNIVHLYNFGQENASFVLAMQFVQGKTWERHILESKRLDWRSSLRITVDVLKALEYAHGRGVVHRDMKPSNVLVRAADAAATVMDFGIAKMTTSTRLTATGQTMGTVRYMSPEQVRGQDVDLRTDLYSLGATLYESLTGDTPFDGSTHFEIMTKHLSEVPKRPSTRGVEIPSQVEDAIMRSLAKRAADRFENARDMRRVFEAALRQGDVGLVETQRISGPEIESLRANPPRQPETPHRAVSLADELEPGMTGTQQVPARRRARWSWAVVAAVLLASTAAAIYVVKHHHPRGYTPVAQIDDVTLTAGKQFGPVLVETDGIVTPDQVHIELVQALDELGAFQRGKYGVSAKLDVFDEIVALPKGELCQAKLYGGQPPKDCATALAQVTYGAKKSRVVLVADAPGTLAQAVKAGIGSAVCLFQQDVASDESDKICTMTAQFAPSQRP